MQNRNKILFRDSTRTLLLLLIMLVTFANGPNGETVRAAYLSEGYLLTGTADQTPYYIIDSGVSGTTFMLIGGTHGNESAGYLTANLARNFVLNSGKLIVIPSLCIDNINNNRRDYPVGHVLYNYIDNDGDPNRYFPKPSDDYFSINYAHTNLGIELVNFILVTNPKWVVDLHESLEYNEFDEDNTGQTIIQYNNQTTGEAIVDAVNNDLVSIDGLDDEDDEYEYKSFRRLSPGVEGSISRAVNHTWDDDVSEDKVAFMVETAKSTDESGIPDPPLDERIKFQKRVIKHSLVNAGLITAKPISSISSLSKNNRAITIQYNATGGFAPFYYYVECKRNSGSWARVYSGLNYQFVYNAPSTGTYYFRVKSRSNDTTAFGTDYGVTSTVRSVLINN